MMRAPEIRLYHDEICVDLFSGVGAPFPCGPCPKCVAAVDRDVDRFRREVFLGVYDAQGYTPAERQQEERRSR